MTDRFCGVCRATDTQVYSNNGQYKIMEMIMSELS